jgi:NAD-dependent SIR2 family protein deacetylase
LFAPAISDHDHSTYLSHRALKAQPNAAHLALASFSLPWLRHAVAPDSTFTLITQNVDGLSTRALQRVEILSTAPEGYIRTDEQPRMLEMHGRLFNLQCSSDSCEHLEYNTTSPVCESLAGLEALVEEGTLDPEIPVQSLPRCSKCGSLARPGVVWFGEIPQYLDTIDELVKRADLCIVVGTSSTVRRSCVNSGCIPTDLISRCTPLPATQQKSNGKAARSQFSIWRGARETKRQISYSWGHVKRCFQVL